MIRPAKAADTNAILALFREAHARSPWKDQSEIDEAYAKREVIQKAILYHGHKTMLGTNAVVADRDGLITGIHIGVKQRMGVISTALYATDLLFVVGKKASPYTAAALIKNFEAWAQKDPRIIAIKPGVNSDVDDWRSAQSLYERLGYEMDGAILRKPIERERKAA